ncbi:MAG: GNAT family N-acetyltransferase [Acholeplasmataceae bacterium]|jgi:hypothetical protein|nr:YgjV family protein [Acholeplasmataceae bacterium]
MIGWQEWIGYVASLIVLISLLMSSVKRLRWINLIGSAVFATYGFLIGALPVALMNLGIVIINVYYLYQMYTTKDYFKLLLVTDMTYFKMFIESYEKDMKHFMAYDESLDNPKFERIFILRNTVPAGILVGLRKDHQLEIHVDYVTPAFRDFKVGDFLYNEQKTFFKDKGITELISKPGNEQHQKYLKKMGFVKDKDNQYIKAL